MKTQSQGSENFTLPRWVWIVMGVIVIAGIVLVNVMPHKYFDYLPWR